MTYRPNLASTLPGFVLTLLAILATITKADDAHPIPALIEFEQSATAAKQALADQRSTLLDDIRNDPLASNITLGRIQPDAVNALIEQRTLSVVLPTTPGTAQRAAKRSTNIPAPIVFTGVALTHHTDGMIGVHAADDPTGNETQIVIDGNDVVGWIRNGDGHIHKLHPLGNGLIAVYEYDTSQLRHHPPNWRPDAYRKTDQRDQQRNVDPATPARSEPPDRINELMRERTKRFRQRTGKADDPSPATRRSPSRAANTDTGDTVDLMILYTPAARAYASNIDLSIQLLINETNHVYDNSLVNLTAHIVHTQQVNYTEGPMMLDDITRLLAPGDNHMDEVHFLRDTHGADLVVLLTDSNSKKICGYASTPNFDKSPNDDHSHLGFSVIGLRCGGVGTYSLAHEIGHNYGMNHDPAHVSNDRFPYGHGYCNTGAGWRTVMAYNPESEIFRIKRKCKRRIPYFSSPGLIFEGEATGDADTRDNRRVLIETAQRVANYRQSKPRTREPTESNTLIIPYIPAPGPLSQAFISFANSGAFATNVTAQLYDEHGSEIAFVTISLPSKTTRWVNSNDLVQGNSSKGVLLKYPVERLRGGTLWARVTADNLVTAYAYLRSPTGFVTTMSRTAETITLEDGRNTASLPFFNPKSNIFSRSVLRLVNPSEQPRTIIIDAWDRNGDSGVDSVKCTLDPYGILQLTAAALEDGPANPACTGKWGNGEGKWFVQISDETAQDNVLIAMSLLQSTITGLVSNMSNPELTPIGETASPPPPPPGIEVDEVFRDCVECPELVVVPAGTYMMGSPPDEEGRSDSEGPQHEVTIEKPFAVGVNEVTFEEWDACVSGGGCRGYRPDDEGWGRGTRPVISVNWLDAQAYVKWLSKKTGEEYRLLSESEWEYVARAGTGTRYSWGDSIGVNRANCGRCGSWWDGKSTAPVRSFEANGFGVYDMHGNVNEWVQDCWNDSYRGAPVDGSAWESGNCEYRVLRGGGWIGGPRSLRSRHRRPFKFSQEEEGIRRVRDLGFRIARTLTP